MAAAERATGIHALVLPPPSFGFSPHHQAWPGTITLRLNTFLALITDVAESVARAGFDRLLIVNGHGGNNGPLASICTELVSRGLRVAAVSYFAPGEPEWAKLLPGQKRGVGHACAYETALQLALRPTERQHIEGRIHALPPRLVPAYVEGEGNPLAGTGATYAALFPRQRPRLLRRPSRRHTRHRRSPTRSHHRRPSPASSKPSPPPNSRSAPKPPAKSPLPPALRHSHIFGLRGVGDV